MTANVSDWVGELTTTVGSGDISLGGQLDGYAPFDTIPDGQVWYSIKDGINRESGQGALKENGTVLERTILSATLISNQYTENPATALPLSGLANVYCTFNKAAFDEFNSSITKLAGIEDGATADQTSAEVPYPNAEQDNVEAALDHLYSAIGAYTSLVGVGGYTSAVTFSNSINASSFNVASISDGVTPIEVLNVPNGSYTLTIHLQPDSIDLLNLNILWPDSEAPVLTSNLDLITLTTIDNGSTWIGSSSLDHYIKTADWGGSADWNILSTGAWVTPTQASYPSEAIGGGTDGVLTTIDPNGIPGSAGKQVEIDVIVDSGGDEFNYLEITYTDFNGASQDEDVRFEDENVYIDGNPVAGELQIDGRYRFSINIGVVVAANLIKVSTHENFNYFGVDFVDMRFI